MGTNTTPHIQAIAKYSPAALHTKVDAMIKERQQYEKEKGINPVPGILVSRVMGDDKDNDDHEDNDED